MRTKLQYETKNIGMSYVFHAGRYIRRKSLMMPGYLYIIFVVLAAIVAFVATWYAKRKSEIETMTKISAAKVESGDWTEQDAAGYELDTEKKVNRASIILGLVAAGVSALLLVASALLYAQCEMVPITTESGTYRPVMVKRDGELIKYTDIDGNVVGFPVSETIFASTAYDNGCYIVVRSDEEAEADKVDSRRYIVYIPQGRALTEDGVVMTKDLVGGVGTPDEATSKLSEIGQADGQ